MAREMDDYTSDMKFGQWLRDQRAAKGFTIEQAAERTGLSVERIKSLELGYSERGVTKSESTQLCTAYGIGLDLFLERACGV